MTMAADDTLLELEARASLLAPYFTLRLSMWTARPKDEAVPTSLWRSQPSDLPIHAIIFRPWAQLLQNLDYAQNPLNERNGLVTTLISHTLYLRLHD